MKVEISFEEFLSRLKTDAEKYFGCACQKIQNDDEEIFMRMSKKILPFSSDAASGNFDCGYEQWHINSVFYKNGAVAFSYRNLGE